MRTTRKLIERDHLALLGSQVEQRLCERELVGGNVDAKEDDRPPVALQRWIGLGEAIHSLRPRSLAFASDPPHGHGNGAFFGNAGEDLHAVGSVAPLADVIGSIVIKPARARPRGPRPAGAAEGRISSRPDSSSFLRRRQAPDRLPKVRLACLVHDRVVL